MTRQVRRKRRASAKQVQDVAGGGRCDDVQDVVEEEEDGSSSSSSNSSSSSSSSSGSSESSSESSSGSGSETDSEGSSAEDAAAPDAGTRPMHKRKTKKTKKRRRRRRKPLVKNTGSPQPQRQHARAPPGGTQLAENHPSGYRKCNCLLIYTGGTFGMRRGEHGELEPAPLRDILDDLWELKQPDCPDWSLLSWDDPVDSSDMGPKEWKRLAQQIEEHYFDFDCFVIMHGTDTMAYTASALSFMLVNLGKPVVLTGAMVSLHELHNDAKRNLTLAMIIAGYCNFGEVCIYFNNRLFRGNRATKVDNVNISAFDSPNLPPLARTGVRIELERERYLPPPTRRFEVCTDFAEPIIVIYITPGFQASVLEAIANTEPPPKAVLLQAFGSGNLPTRNPRLSKVVQEVASRGIPIAVMTQCASGTTDMLAYEAGKLMVQAGAINCFDMTAEAAYTKLGYLIGRGITGDDLRHWMETPLRGEMTVSQVDTASFLAVRGPGI